MCMIIMICHLKGFLYSIILKMSFILIQLLTTLENKILDEHKHLQKCFMISPLYLSCYNKELIGVLYLMVCMRCVLSMDIVLCHRSLLHQPTIHVYWHHKPHFCQTTHDLLHIPVRAPSSQLAVPQRCWKLYWALGFFLDGHIMSLMIAYIFFYWKAFLNKFNYTLVIIQHDFTTPVNRENL